MILEEIELFYTLDLCAIRRSSLTYLLGRYTFTYRRFIVTRRKLLATLSIDNDAQHEAV